MITVEVIFRMVMSEPENLAKLKLSSAFLYENKPNSVFPYSREGEFNNLIKINSFGFRDDEFSKEKNQGVFRIAVLGDSQEEALQVELEDTWQKILARKLSESLGRPVETYNFGVSGYGTDQEWLTLREKVWQFRPDMVILAFSPNDVGDVYKNKLVRVKDGKVEIVSVKERAGGNILGKAARETYIYHLIIKAASFNSFTKALVDKVRIKILGFPKEERFFLSDAQLVEGPFEVIASQKNPPKEVLEAWETVGALVVDMKRQTDEHNGQFLMTVNIPRAQVLPSDWQYLAAIYRLDPNSSSAYEINEVMAKIADEAQINFYDPRLAAIEWKESHGDLHFAKDAHFNKNGHLFMGEVVAEYILRGGLIDNSPIDRQL